MAFLFFFLILFFAVFDFCLSCNSKLYKALSESISPIFLCFSFLIELTHFNCSFINGRQLLNILSYFLLNTFIFLTISFNIVVDPSGKVVNSKVELSLPFNSITGKNISQSMVTPTRSLIGMMRRVRLSANGPWITALKC